MPISVVYTHDQKKITNCNDGWCYSVFFIRKELELAALRRIDLGKLGSCFNYINKDNYNYKLAQSRCAPKCSQNWNLKRKR